MADNKQAEIKEYADGWITERSGTDAPGFLKLAFPVIGLGCVAYFIIYANGEVSHPDRGALVQKLNESTGLGDGMIYTAAALALLFVVLVVSFAFRKFHD